MKASAWNPEMHSQRSPACGCVWSGHVPQACWIRGCASCCPERSVAALPCQRLGMSMIWLALDRCSSLGIGHSHPFAEQEAWSCSQKASISSTPGDADRFGGPWSSSHGDGWSCVKSLFGASSCQLSPPAWASSTRSTSSVYRSVPLLPCWSRHTCRFDVFGLSRPPSQLCIKGHLRLHSHHSVSITHQPESWPFTLLNRCI